MPTKPEAHEYFGSLTPKAPPTDFLDVKPRSAPLPIDCQGGHLWPEGAGSCARCGRPSSFPNTDNCRHGVASKGTFGGHDCKYADARDGLVYYAALAADEEYAKSGLRIEQKTSDQWDRAFHIHMERLVALAKDLLGTAVWVYAVWKMP